MAGGGDTVDLVAAVSNAGGMGFFGAAYSSPSEIVQRASQIRARTPRPFGINLFVIPEDSNHSNLQAAMQRLSKYYEEFQIGRPAPPPAPAYTVEQQLDAVLESSADAFSFIFGSLPKAAIEKVKAKGIYVMGTATTVVEAVELADLGVDAVIAQGAEAGGHRGSFDPKAEPNMVGTMALVPQIVDAVKIPALAAGGIMDGRGIVAALALGAQAVQMGTAFLNCKESGIPQVYREALLSTREDQITTTRAFSGRPARGIENRFIREMRAAEQAGDLLPFPTQNSLTRPIRNASAKNNSPEFLSLWAGQGIRLSRQLSAAELIDKLCFEISEVAKKIPQLLQV